MKKLSLTALHRTFSVAALALFGIFAGFLIYLYVAFNQPLTGDVHVDQLPDLLSALQEQKIEAVVHRLDAREHLPDVPADLPNPFAAR